MYVCVYAHTHTYTHTDNTYIIRNWLTWLWKLRSPMMCRQQAGDPGERMVWFQCESKSPRTRRANDVSSSLYANLKAGEGQSPANGKHRERILMYPALLFYSGLQWIRGDPLMLGSAICFI